MTNADIIEWLHSEFLPITLATPDDTLLQVIKNAKRYWNTHSAYPMLRMYAAPGTSQYSQQESNGLANNRIRLDPDFKNVVKVYPATTPDWILQNYPLWSLLGITIIDNLTSDLIMLSEAYRNYRYYIGTDFQFKYIRSEDPQEGGWLNLVNLPSNSQSLCVIGTKRIIYDTVKVRQEGLSGTLQYAPVSDFTFSITDGNLTYNDDGAGVLLPSQSGYLNGTINYTTGEWSVSDWSPSAVLTQLYATYEYTENIKSEYILNWLLYYIKALTKQVEGNALRKTTAIDIKNDGQQLLDEGKEEVLTLQKRMFEDGRWMAFARRF